MKLIAFQRRKTLHLRRERSHTETSRHPTENPLTLSTETNDRVIEIRYRGDKSCAVKVGLDMRKKCFVRTSQNLQD